MIKSAVDQSLKTARGIIEKMPDPKLYSDGAVDSILSEIEFNHLQLDGRKKLDIKSTKLSSQNPPPDNFTFIPGNTYEYVEYKQPVVSNELLSSFFKQSNLPIWGLSLESLAMGAGYQFVLRLLSKETRLEKDEKELDRLREAARAEFENLERRIQECNDEIDKLNEKMKLDVEDMVKKERIDRDDRKKALQRLDF